MAVCAPGPLDVAPLDAAPPLVRARVEPIAHCASSATPADGEKPRDASLGPATMRAVPPHGVLVVSRPLKKNTGRLLPDDDDDDDASPRDEKDDDLVSADDGDDDDPGEVVKISEGEEEDDDAQNPAASRRRRCCGRRPRISDDDESPPPPSRRRRRASSYSVRLRAARPRLRISGRRRRDGPAVWLREWPRKNDASEATASERLRELRLRVALGACRLARADSSRGLAWKLFLGVGALDAAGYVALVESAPCAGDDQVRDDAERTHRGFLNATRVLSPSLHRGDDDTDGDDDFEAPLLLPPQTRRPDDLPPKTAEEGPQPAPSSAAQNKRNGVVVVKGRDKKKKKKKKQGLLPAARDDRAKSSRRRRRRPALSHHEAEKEPPCKEALARAVNALRRKLGERDAHGKGVNRCFITAVMLATLPSELDAFHAVLALATRHCPAYFASDLRGVGVGAALVSEVLNVVDPELVDALVASDHRLQVARAFNGGTTAASGCRRRQTRSSDSSLATFEEICAFPVLASLFSCCGPPLKHIVRLWDVLFAVGVHFAVVLCAALCVSLRDVVLANGRTAVSPLTLLQPLTLPKFDADDVARVALRDLAPRIPDALYRLIWIHAKLPEGQALTRDSVRRWRDLDVAGSSSSSSSSGGGPYPEPPDLYRATPADDGASSRSPSSSQLVPGLQQPPSSSADALAESAADSHPVPCTTAPRTEAHPPVHRTLDSL